MIILGIDPGFHRLGWAIIKKQEADFNVLAFSLIETKSGTDYQKRVLEIGEKLNTVIKKHRPETVAIEKLFFTKNQKTALKVAEIKGIVIYLAAKAGIPCFEFTPLEVKSAICGYGKADKKQIQNMLKLTLKNFSLPPSDDICDAIAVGLTCCFVKNQPSLL